MEAADPPLPQTHAVVITAQHVLTFVPNLIGYTRILLVLISLVLLLAWPKEYWIVAVLCYVGGFVGDLFDGWAARLLHQTSSFGGVMDMVTDRCSTLGLLCILGYEYEAVDSTLKFPWFRFAFLMLQILDVSSHWCQTYATLALGMHHKSKEGNADKSFLVRWFYQYYYFFGYLCCGAEFTYVLLLVRSRLLQSGPVLLGMTVESLVRLVDLSLMVTIPGCVAKQMVNVMQLASACYAIAHYDAETTNKRPKAS